MNLEQNLEKAARIKEVLKDSKISQEAQALAQMGAIMGASNDSIIQGLVSVQDAQSKKDAETESKRTFEDKPKDYTKTQSALHDMLTENTGVAMMDSGGAYGRHWQTNRSINDFRELDAVLVSSWSKGDYCISKNIFHVLDNICTYEPAKTKEFLRLSNRGELKDAYWIECMEAYAKNNNDQSYYLTESKEPQTENSYNSDNCLSQTIQFTPYAMNNQSYIILQIHGGADVRGGYSDPKIFSCELDELFIAYHDLWASCKCLDADSQNGGYTWSEEIESWSYSERLKGVYCRDCKERVSFG